jgi:hypothetical protein
MPTTGPNEKRLVVNAGKRISLEHARARAPRPDRNQHIDARLDAALEQTFPASDPVAISYDS